MNNQIKTFLIWFIAFIFTAFMAVYQRKTGPSYPISGTKEIGSQKINYKLIRTYDGNDDAPITIVTADTNINGELKFRRFKSYDKWETQTMSRSGDTLIGLLPHQSPAGKVMYEVTLVYHGQRVQLDDHPAVLRYKGHVPGYILIPHIIFIFLAMMFSTLTGLEALFMRKKTLIYSWITVITLLLGGLILGPIVQKFSFDTYWAGWPFGHDLTDNKSLVAFIFWIIALIVQIRNRKTRIWPVVAAIVMLIVFLIPHSMLGSEIDFTKEQKTEVYGN
jgi:hypothetical protein